MGICNRATGSRLCSNTERRKINSHPQRTELLAQKVTKCEHVLNGLGRRSLSVLLHCTSRGRGCVGGAETSSHRRRERDVVCTSRRTITLNSTGTEANTHTGTVEPRIRVYT